jgi:hypothetical protein
VTGAGIVILGMHRSGTSAITRMVNLLGVPTCHPADLIRDRTGNLRGHWESGTLVKHNDELLRAVGGAWWCPPPLDTDWLAVAGGRMDSAAGAFYDVHTTPSWVWKDPRTCVTAPFWIATLPQRLTFLLVVRHPVAVAASLAKRSGLTPEGGIALWEGYMARAARAATGASVLVCSYEAMLDDPIRWAGTAKEFALAQGIELDEGGSTALAAEFVEQTLTHHRLAATDVEQLTDEQTTLFATLTASVGSHERFDPDLPPVTAATERLFDERRRMLVPPAQRSAPEDQTPSGIQLLKPATRSSDELPSISVVVAPRRADVDVASTLDALRATAPASAQMLVVGQFERPLDPGVTILDRPGGSRVDAIRVALACAGGDVVVVCDGGVEPNPGWPEVLAYVLRGSDVGVVGPALLHSDGAAVFGLAFRDDCLNVTWITNAPTVGPFPVAVVPGAMMAFRRDVLEAVGGFDSGMTGSGGEDTELCVRFWRAGYSCLNVPRASAVVQFELGSDKPADAMLFLQNRIRLGALHLSPPRLARFLEPCRSHPHFAEAFARVVASDLGARRALVDAISCFDDVWFLHRFNVSALVERERIKDDSETRREHELVHP